MVGDEIKGSKLNESQINELVSGLMNFDAFFYSVVVDRGIDNEDVLNQHKSIQADMIVSRLTDKHSPLLVEQLYDVRKQLLGMNNQLYVQCRCLVELVDIVFRLSTVYYSRSISSCLYKFDWVIDSKDTVVTNYELLWKDIVNPLLQSKSLVEPLIQLTEGDYSYFSRFYAEFPEYLKEHVVEGEKTYLCSCLNKILGDNVNFQNSKQSTGLQIVDNLCNAFRRSLNNRLGYSGYQNFGKIMIKNFYNKTPFSLICFTKDINPTRPYFKVLSHYTRTCKSII